MENGAAEREAETMEISEAIDRGEKARWRHDLLNMLTDAGRTLAGTGLQVNGVRYQGVLLGPLLMRAAAALEKCWKHEGLIQDAAKPDKPGDVAPVVHGEWEAVDWREYDANGCEVICYPKDGIACTHCRYVFKKDALWKKNFCPNCGAKMDGGAEMAEYIDKVEYCEKH